MSVGRSQSSPLGLTRSAALISHLREEITDRDFLLELLGPLNYRDHSDRKSPPFKTGTFPARPLRARAHVYQRVCLSSRGIRSFHFRSLSAFHLFPPLSLSMLPILFLFLVIRKQIYY